MKLEGQPMAAASLVGAVVFLFLDCFETQLRSYC